MNTSKLMNWSVYSESGVEVKGGTDQGKAKTVGTKLAKVFKCVPDGTAVNVDGYFVERHLRPVMYAGEGKKMIKFYVFYKPAPNQDEDDEGL